MQAGRLGVGCVEPQSLEVVVDVAVGDEAIGPAVVVEVAERAAPAHPEHAVVEQAAGAGSVLEQSARPG